LFVQAHDDSAYADEAAPATVAAPVNEDLNEEEDEAPEENALAETAAVEKKAAKDVARQQKVSWVGESQAGANGRQMYRCSFSSQPANVCVRVWIILLLEIMCAIIETCNMYVLSHNHDRASCTHSGQSR